MLIASSFVVLMIGTFMLIPTILNFFKDILKWMSDIIFPVVKRLWGELLVGAKILLSNIVKGIKGIFQKIESYAFKKGKTKEENQWFKQTDIRKIAASEVPEDIREQVESLEENQEIDITEKTINQLPEEHRKQAIALAS